MENDGVTETTSFSDVSCEIFGPQETDRNLSMRSFERHVLRSQRDGQHDQPHSEDRVHSHSELDPGTEQPRSVIVSISALAARRRLSRDSGQLHHTLSRRQVIIFSLGEGSCELFQTLPLRGGEECRGGARDAAAQADGFSMNS